MKRFNSSLLFECFMAVPWVSDDEFYNVGSLMASSNVENWKIAKDRLTIWKSRQGARLQDIFDISLAILGNLVNAAVGGTGGSLNDIIHSSSLTIVRFVNLLTEGSLKEKIERSSVLELAAKIGIPDWIVDLRHEIVHKRLPSLAMLNKALLFAKTYVCEHFWLLDSNRVDKPSLSEIRQYIRGVLNNTDDFADQRKENIKVLFSYTKFIRLSVVLEEVVNYFVESLKAFPISDVGNFSLPKTVRSTTYPVCDVLRKCGMLSFVLNTLLERMYMIPSDTDACAVWVLKVLSLYSGSYIDENSLSDKLLRVFLLVPSLFSSVDKLANLLNLTLSDDLHALRRIYGGGSDGTEVKESAGLTNMEVNRIYSVSDVQKQSWGSKTGQPRQQDSVWQLADDIDWSAVALGSLPGNLNSIEKCVMAGLPEKEARPMCDYDDRCGNTSPVGKKTLLADLDLNMIRDSLSLII